MKSYKRAWATMTLCMVASSCSIIEEYIRPSIAVQDEWSAPLPHDGNVASLTNWWAQFNDPVLSTLLVDAQQENPTLDKAVGNIQLARANLRSSSAKLWPSLTGSGSMTKSQGGGVGFASSMIESDKASLDASWELDLFGKLVATKESSKATLASRELDWHQARLTLAAEVATNYVNYRACELTYATLNRTRNSRDETLRLTEIASKAGFTAPAEVALAQAALGASESLLFGQQAECESTIKSLVALTGKPESDIKTLLKTGHDIPVPTAFEVKRLPAKLITRRPDLASDERKLAAASKDIGVAKAQLYPSISLTGSIGYQRIDLNGFVTKTDTWSYGPSISLPIFDGGSRKAQVETARANFDIALATYKQDVRNAVKEVEQALVNLDSATQREKAELASARQYQIYFEAAQKNWKSGGADLLALEDARRQLLSAELNTITQKKNRVLQWITLYKAFGGDWYEQSITNEPATAENVEVK